jgi:hypothetical protein
MQLEDAYRPGYRAYHGHHRFGLHSFVPYGVPFKYLTLLRNPADRLVSHARNFGDGTRTVEELLEQQPEQNNLMVRMLSGSDDGDLTSKHLQKAIDNLSQPWFSFGLTERYAAFVGSLGWEVGERLNKGPPRDGYMYAEIPKRAVELDYHLYDWAKERAP